MTRSQFYRQQESFWQREYLTAVSKQDWSRLEEIRLRLNHLVGEVRKWLEAGKPE